MAFLRYHALSSNVADLGFFDNNLFNFEIEPQRLFYGHFQPLLYFYAKLYVIFPIEYLPVLLIVAQSTTLCLSVFAVTRFFGNLSGIVMALYYPLWVNALFDFHIDHLSIPLIIGYFVACEYRRFSLAALSACFLVLVKEPFALQAVGCGCHLFYLSKLYKFRDLKAQLRRLSLMVVLWGLGSFYFITQYVLPFYGNGMPGVLDSTAYSWLGFGLVEKMITVITEPHIIIYNILSTEGKLKYVLVVFGLLGFIPLLRPSALIVAFPILAISLLSNLENYYGFANHYTAGLIVPLIVAFRDGVISIQEKFNIQTQGRNVFSLIVLAFILFGHFAFASSPISRLFWSDKVWSYSWRAYYPTVRDATIKVAIAKFVPNDRFVSVSTQNTLNWGPLAHRRVYLPFPAGVLMPQEFPDWSNRDLSTFLLFVQTGYVPSPSVESVFADFVVLDLKRPWFVEALGCSWSYGACCNQKIASRFVELVLETRKQYDLVFENDGFIILSKKWR